jgi:hypothetical protein
MSKPMNRGLGDIAFRDPDMERRFHLLVEYAEAHLDDWEQMIRESDLPTLGKLVFGPAILFRRKIYREIGQALAQHSTEELRQVARGVAEQNRKIWERVERALDESDWIEHLDGMLPSLGAAKDRDDE